jgi:hypothetical protein
MPTKPVFGAGIAVEVRVLVVIVTEEIERGAFKSSGGKFGYI